MTVSPHHRGMCCFLSFDIVMKILMLSGDNEIMNKQSEVYERMKAYANLCDELHIVVLGGEHNAQHSRGNLFIYCISGNKIMQRVGAYCIVRSIAKRQHIDVITAQSPDELGLIAYLVARLHGTKLQLQVHTDIMSSWYRRAGILPRIKYTLARFLLPRADCVRVVSQRIARSLIDDLRIPVSLVTVLPVFTDVSAFMRQSSKMSKDARTQVSVCAMIAVGRMKEKEKNFSMLIRAMVEVINTHPTAVLVIVGDGPDKEYYQSLITLFGLERNVFLDPWHNDLPSFYPSFDLLVVPSFIEGWGRVVIEAMASGLPVLMTDVGAAGEVVRDGINGRVVAVGDQSAFAAAINDFCLHPEIRTQLAYAARKTAYSLHPSTTEEYLTQWKKSFDCCFARTHGN